MMLPPPPARNFPSVHLEKESCPPRPDVTLVWRDRRGVLHSRFGTGQDMTITQVEIERLRAALEEIAGMEHEPVRPNGSTCIEVARQALEASRWMT
jgi:hypothetical protein